MKKLLTALVGSILGYALIGVSTAQAATDINFVINSSTQATSPGAVGQCTLTTCDFSNGNNKGTGGLPLTATNQIVYRYNDASYPITSIDYLLSSTDTPNFTFVSGSTSNIFNNIQVLQNGAELLFSGGSIAPGGYFSVARNYNPQSTSTYDPLVTVTYNVPEPSSILGSLVGGALVLKLGSLKKKRQ